MGCRWAFLSLFKAVYDDAQGLGSRAYFVGPVGMNVLGTKTLNPEP